MMTEQLTSPKPKSTPLNLGHAPKLLLSLPLRFTKLIYDLTQRFPQWQYPRPSVFRVVEARTHEAGLDGVVAPEYARYGRKELFDPRIIVAVAFVFEEGCGALVEGFAFPKAEGFPVPKAEVDWV